MIVLDTNVVSEFERPTANLSVREWYRHQDRQELYLTATTVAEISFGANRIFLRDKSERYQIALNFMLANTFSGKILEFGTLAALENGKIRSAREAAGKTIPLNDAQIAAICLVHGATLATRNVRDFEGLGLKLVNPFEAKA